MKGEESMKKRVVSLVLAAVLALSMTACGSKEAETTAAPETTTAAPAETTAAAAETTAAEAPEETTAAPAVVIDKEAWKAFAEEGMTTTIECEPLEVSLGCSGTIEGTVQGDSVEFAQEALERWTNGAVVVNFYPSGQLGGDVELIEGAQMGSVDMFMGAPSSQVTLIPELAVVDIGGLFPTVESCNKVLVQFKDMIQPYYEEAGLHIMNMYTTNFRILSSNKPVATAADLQGLNIRTQENKYHMTFWKELGTNPTPLAFGELYLALQQGMMDAQENPWGSIYGPKLYEVQKYVVETNHIPFINTLVMSGSRWNSLSDNQKLALEQFGNYMQKYQTMGSAADDARMAQECIDAVGLEVTPVSEEIAALFPAAAAAVVEQMKQDIDPAFVDNYMAMVEAAK